MKYSVISYLRRFFTSIVLALTLASAAQARAGIALPQSISIDEAGHGTETFGPGLSFALTGIMAPDPGPGGRASALTYTVPYLFFVGGDLFLTEAGGTSDIIRFNYSSTTGASIVFYSLAGEGQLADTGFPSSFNTNTFSLAENPFGPTSYTPTAGQPGFLGAGFNPLTYFINSPSAVPENGSSLGLLAAALLSLVVLRCRLSWSQRLH